jgi:hypothetical protein
MIEEPVAQVHYLTAVEGAGGSRNGGFSAPPEKGGEGKLTSQTVSIGFFVADNDKLIIFTELS